MTRVHEFYHSNRLCKRWELEGKPVSVLRRTELTAYRGEDLPTAVEIWSGEHMLDDGRKVWRVERSAVSDGGEKLGVALVYTELRQPPAGEREQTRARLSRVLSQLYPGLCLKEN